jgi:hypothetical protein
MVRNSDDVEDFVEITFIADRETKNTVRFSEHVPAGGQARTKSPIYLTKDMLKRLGDPERLRFTIENADFEPYPK